MEPTFWQYLRHAFNARPKGMFVAPNWIGLGVFAFLGVLNWGLWAIGAGLELAYLLWLSSNPRFRKYVRSRYAGTQQAEWAGKVDRLLERLEKGDLARYRALEARCRSILERSQEKGSALHAQGLARLLWLYLRLLAARQNLVRLLEEVRHGEDEAGLTKRAGELRQRAMKESTEDLRRSLESQAGILEQRLENTKEARRKLKYLEAELERIQQQVELLREEVALSSSAESVSHRIDALSETLSGATSWVREQEQLFGTVDAELSEAPPLLTE